MTIDWMQLEGVTIAGRYWLKQCLSSSADEAWYSTRYDAAACNAAVRVVRGDAAFAQERLQAWREAVTFDHPHLIRMYDTGLAQAAGMDLIYAVCECPDDYLANALAERTLSTTEAEEVLRASLSALEFLHSRGFAHGAVAAAQVISVGERIKLPSDTLRHSGAWPGAADLEPCSAPEVAAGGAVTSAADLWSLGAMLTEMLTRRRPTSRAEAGWLPKPFAAIVDHTMKEDPAERWTTQQVAAHLDAPVEADPPPAPEPLIAAAPAAVAAKVEEIVAVPPPIVRHELPPPIRRLEDEIPPQRWPVRKWAPVAGLLAAAGMGAIFLRGAKTPAAKPAPETLPTPPAIAQPAPPQLVPRTAVQKPVVQKPVVQKVESRSSPSAIWRVVVYQYSHREAAEHAARRLNGKRPAWHAEVFTPRRERSAFLVSLGGRMTLAEAKQVRIRALEAGLPRDTFVRNFAE